MLFMCNLESCMRCRPTHNKSPPPPTTSKFRFWGSSYLFYRGDPGENFEHLRRLLVHIIRLILFIVLQVIAGK